METLQESAAVALVAAAAGAVGQCPDGEWEAKVQAKAFSLLRIVPKVVAQSEILAATKTVTGVIAAVEEIKGRGVITSHATIGTPQRGQDVVNGRGVEHFRTEFLNTATGQAMFEHAQSLIGRHCRFGKRVEEYVDKAGQAAKVSMCEWIEDIGPDPLTVGATSAPSAPQRNETPRTPPPATTAPSSDIDPDQWFRENGWRDKADHDKARKELTGALSAAEEPVKQDFTTWAERTKGYNLRAAWPAEQAMLMKAKIVAMMDEHEEREMVAAGGVVEYGLNEEPF